MKYLFRLIRWPLGQLVIFFDRITRPSSPVHPPEKRAELDAITASMKLYQFKQCPYCVKTRRSIRRLGLNIETRDARNDPQWHSELINQGGQISSALPASGESRWFAAMDVWLERHYRLPGSALRINR